MTPDPAVTAVSDEPAFKAAFAPVPDSFLQHMVATAPTGYASAAAELLRARSALSPSPVTARSLLIEAEALLCDERGGPAANELAMRIRSALADVGECEWQPIDNAPTVEGHSVMIWQAPWPTGAEGHYCDGGWYFANNHPSDAWGRQVYPTHWQPMPAAPDTGKQPRPAAEEPRRDPNTSYETLEEQIGRDCSPAAHTAQVTARLSSAPWRVVKGKENVGHGWPVAFMGCDHNGDNWYIETHGVHASEAVSEPENDAKAIVAWRNSLAEQGSAKP